MGLEQAGNVLYFGFFASFFGGWVPVRSKNIKLAVFHLYLFLSMLVFPLVVYLVDGTHIAGWIVYGVFIAISFSILKITNFRLHKALGNDPPPPSPPGSDGTPSLVDSEDRKEESVKVGISLEEGGEREKSAEVAVLTEEDISRHRSSASTLNEGSSSQTNPNTPDDVELSQISQPLTESITVPMEANTDSEEQEQAPPLNINSNPEDYSSADGINERTPSSGSRQRVCHRSVRQNSRSSGGGREQLEISNPRLIEVRDHLRHSRHPQLADVVNKMPPQIHEAILSDTIPSEALDSLVERIGQLRNGHLAIGDDDNSPGAIHWIADDYEFYVFDEPELEDDNSSEVLAAALQFDAFRQFHDTIANDPIAPREATLPNNVDHTHDSAPPDAPPIPYIFLLPKIAKTKVVLNFTRRQLEEYMDRNVSRLEVVCAILLAVMVCVIGALLFTLTDFYYGFWVFALCFVIATVHFSLIKSVQSDPASPSPGQNRINAMSRAGYFIVVGSLGLLLNGVLEHTDSFTPACLYGFNYNNPVIIQFARDGLFIFILFIPVLFTLGWMPQCDTFLINVLEHIDIYVFGGTASTGLLCSLYSLMRNAIAVVCLLPLGYLAFLFLETEPDYVGSDCGLTFYDYHDNQNISTIFNRQCTNSGRIALSFFLGGVVMTAYALSRSTTNHQYIVDVLHYCYKKILYKFNHTHNFAPPIIDPLEEMYRKVMSKRLLVDIMICSILMITVTVLNLTSVFCQIEILAYVIYGITALLGIVNHYFLPHARKETPYLCFSKPCITSKEYDEFEVTEQPQVSLVEQILQVTLFLEKNIFYPLTFLFGLNIVAVYYRAKFGEIGAAFVVSIVGIKLFRSAYSELSRQHVILILTLLFFNVDYAHLNEGLPFNYFIIAILFTKIYELYLKVYFILIYIMPGSWSSPFHIIIQPLLIPHCPLIFFETLVGAVMNAPMNPVIASSMFFLSYARPIKFWEKDYNTKRRDTSNTRLEQQLDTNIRNPNPDHLDSLFYEQLSWSLQRDLCGDIMLGRWGRVTSGDFFILTNDQLNALVHIIEIGNGFVTFQLRGLEFRGTYCHQREREAITESIADEDSCCYQPPGLLACNKVLSIRWMAWEVVSSSYTLHGYSISENPAHSIFNAYDFKKTFITNYVKCIIYYLFKYPRLPTLLSSIELQESLAGLTDLEAVEYDALFDQQRNTDWGNNGGISRRAFVNTYFDFISTCAGKFPSVTVEIDTSPESFLVTLCFAYSLLGRRLFFTHSSTGSGRRGGDNFMHGLYRMFLGDARPNNEKDDWIFMDVDSIQQVIIPAVRTAFKVHQDNFTYSNELVASEGMYDAIEDTDTNHIVTHENDRLWRDGVVLNRPSLLALRYQRTEDSYNHPYKIIRLTSKFIKFRVVKVNKECVRSLWSSQQHELIFLRNSDSERGSIQNHKASLRNMINSSMDLPIGYPIYVSPLQTSFIDRHIPFHQSLVGRCINPDTYTNGLKRLYSYRCTNRGDNAKPTVIKSSPRLANSTDSLTGERPPVQMPYEEDDSDDDDVWKPIWVGKQVGVANLDEVFYSFNEAWLKWPDKTWYSRATQWTGWSPSLSTQGEVIHEWRPFHVQSTSRSHIDKLIVLVQTSEGHLVLIKEQGIREI